MSAADKLRDASGLQWLDAHNDIIAVIAATEKGIEWCVYVPMLSPRHGCDCSNCTMARLIAALNARLTDSSDGGEA